MGASYSQFESTHEPPTRAIHFRGHELKLGRAGNPKDPISLELVVTLCVNYASSSSLRHLRFLVFLLLGYAGFLRVDKLYSLEVGDISILDDHFAISFNKR